MRIRFIANASFEVVNSHGKRLITDPWWGSGAYLGTWHNYPPIPKSLLADLHRSKPDLLYVSHLHPDHLDPRTLRKFDPSTPVVIGKFENGHLRRAVAGLGFSTIIESEFWSWVEIEGFYIMLLPQFQENSFGVKNSLGYQMDSSIVVRDGEDDFVNLVDNSIAESQALELRNVLGRPSIAAIPYSGASAYPHAFKYSNAVKREKVKELRSRSLSQFRAIVEALNPHIVIPAAGSYVFPAFMADFNLYLQQPNPGEIQSSIDDLVGKTRLVNLNSGSSLWRESDVWKFQDLQQWTDADRFNFGASLEGSLAYSDMRLPEDCPIPWPRVLRRCAENLAKRQQTLEVFCDLEVRIHIAQKPDLTTSFSLSGDIDRKSDSWLSFDVDERLLLLVVTGAVDWNNAEVGSHFLIDRDPDVFNATAHSLMSYFSLVA